ncbi:inosine-uridine preferring nucleoside hydrolase [Microthyrium microscopicum]|uniref:Inosine-uridine preferring nucleoside hydrolase n=1 Tax=Microthyrium microscopicum TaxID=703497 RepID=A0A6A6U965_9PEZI|nr:inosine-uridine preferring nucleoside hydrolase [Microthyrium microscopicum]
MTNKRRIIIDTDPGVDDILAMLLAFSASPEELEVLLISVTYGNVEVKNCLRNVMTLFHIIELEMQWRIRKGLDPGFQTLRRHKPIVAVGASEPLADHQLMADHFHGIDGLGGSHSSHPHLTPKQTWRSLFTSDVSTADPSSNAATQEIETSIPLFVPSKKPAAEEILNILRDNEPDTITIVAIGPLTNLAIAAAQDPETFLRAKEVVVMGGAINKSGNITPVAEFNVFADSVAAARVFALTCPTPTLTMPVLATKSSIGDYPARLSPALKLTLFPLDITEQHNLSRATYTSFIKPLLGKNSPLAEWTDAFLGATFKKLDTLYKQDAPLALHDPLCIWYLLASPAMNLAKEPLDIRIETSGQWTRGMLVTDGRPRAKPVHDDSVTSHGPRDDQNLNFDEVPGDTGHWIYARGNAIWPCVDSPWKADFGSELLKRIFS